MQGIMKEIFQDIWCKTYHVAARWSVGLLLGSNVQRALGQLWRKGCGERIDVGRVRGIVVRHTGE